MKALLTTILKSALLQVAFNAADLMVVGQLGNQESVGAVGASAPIVNLLVNSFIGLSIGINAVLATLLTFLTGVVGNWVMRSMMNSKLTMFSLSLRQLGIIFGLSFGIAIVSSAIPILRIAKQKPVDAIRE